MLSFLSHDARKAIGEAGLFAMNPSNLAALAGNRGRMGLDSIGNKSPATLRRVLDRAPHYFDTIELKAYPSVDDPTNVASLLPVLVEYGPTVVAGVFERCDCAGSVRDLRVLNATRSEEWASTYRTLATYAVFETTTANIVAYLDVVGRLDAPVLTLIEDRGISAWETVDLAVRQALASSIVASDLPVRSIIRIIQSLLSGAQLGADQVKTNRPAVIGALMRAKLLADSPTTLNAIGALPWAVREEAMHRARAAYATPALLELGADELTRVLLSPKLAKDVRSRILREPVLLDRASTPEAASAVVRAANESGLQLAPERLLAVASVGGSGEQVIENLAHSIERVSDDQLLGILGTLGGDWAVLTSPSKRWRLLPDSPGFQPVLERLKVLGLVSKVTSVADGRVRVTMRA